jgi:hypothetical protein
MKTDGPYTKKSRQHRIDGVHLIPSLPTFGVFYSIFWRNSRTESRALHYIFLFQFCSLDKLSLKVILNSNCSESLRFVRHTSNLYYFHIFKKQWKSTKTR